MCQCTIVLYKIIIYYKVAKTAIRQVNKLWRDWNILKKMKVQSVETVIFLIFLDAAETWTLKESDR